VYEHRAILMDQAAICLTGFLSILVTGPTVWASSRAWADIYLRATAHSSYCSASTAPTSLIMAARLGKMPTLFEVIDHRIYRTLPTIYTSNYDLGELASRLRDQHKRLIDRIAGSTFGVEFKGKSFRLIQAQREWNRDQEDALSKVDSNFLVDNHSSTNMPTQVDAQEFLFGHCQQ
jgi:hypothetical protein